jgi:FkbM family methyltransferase
MQSLSIGYKFPETYYTKSLYHSWRNQWEEAYMVASLALSILTDFSPQFRNPYFVYNSKKDLLFQKGLCAMKTLRMNEARQIFIELDSKHMFNSLTRKDIWQNNDYNYSQAFQDVLVEKIYDKKKNGTYLEIGANDYRLNNNTYLLEKDYDWKGISVEIDGVYEPDFKKYRKNTFVLGDATTINYKELLKDMPKTIDYLQVDCEPSQTTYDVLLKIPFDEYKFGVITYEHDHYDDRTKSFKQKSREFLRSKGYVLLVGNITPDVTEQLDFEDWWVHPDCVEHHHLFVYENGTTPLFAEKYIKYLDQMKSELNITKKYFEVHPGITTINNYHNGKSAQFKLYKNCIISDCYRKGFVWEEHQHHLINTHLNSESVVIEAGSHVGTETVKLSKVCKKVYTFEPVPVTYSLLRQNLDLNKCDNVCALKKGLSNVIGETVISYVDPGNPGGTQLLGGENETNLNEELKVELTTIDDLNLDRLDYIKLDVETYEHLVLQGGIETIKKYKPKIILEHWKNETLEKKFKFLLDIGYVSLRIFHDDYLFVPIEYTFHSIVNNISNKNQNMCWGFCSHVKAEKIQKYVKSICNPSPTCVEIGVFGGMSCIPVLLELKKANKGGVLYAIDPWDNIEATKGYQDVAADWWSNVDLSKIYSIFKDIVDTYDFSKFVNIIKLPSDDAPTFEEIDYLYIDGQHTEQAFKDIDKYATKIVNDGILILDDINWSNVTRELPTYVKNLGFRKIDQVDDSIIFKKKKKLPQVLVFDNFYDDPDSVRDYALKLNYQPPDNHGAVGFRSEEGRKIFKGTKEFFEKVLDCHISDGNSDGGWNYSTNGCFQWCDKSTPLVYHADSQEYAGIIYLTPDAPPNTGTSFYRHKKYKSMNGWEIFKNKDWYEGTIKEYHTDPEPWEMVDSIGNVYNRLVIFKSTNIHAVTEYFGENINDSRLFQLFFFDII